MHFLEIEMPLSTSQGILGGIIAEQVNQAKFLEDDRQAGLIGELSEAFLNRIKNGLEDRKGSLRVNHLDIKHFGSPLSPYVVRWSLRSTINACIDQVVQSEEPFQELYLRRFRDDYQEIINQGLRDFLLIRDLKFDLRKTPPDMLEVSNSTDQVVQGSLEEQLKIYRESLSLGRIQLAQMIGVDNSHLYRVELGQRKMSRNMALLLVKVLGLNTEQAENFVQAAGFSTKILTMHEVFYKRRRGVRSDKGQRRS